MTKVLERLLILGAYINIIKTVYRKLIDNINLNIEKCKATPLKTGTRKSCSLSPYLLSIALEVLTRTIRQLEETKGINFKKEEVKLSLFADNKIIYISNAKYSTGKFLQVINIFRILLG